MGVQPRGEVTANVAQRSPAGDVAAKSGTLGPVFDGPMASSAGQLLWGPGPLPGLDVGLGSPRSARAAQHYARSGGRFALNEQAALLRRMSMRSPPPPVEEKGDEDEPLLATGSPRWATSPRLLGSRTAMRPLDCRPATSQARMQTAWQAREVSPAVEERLGEAAFGTAWKLVRGVEARTRRTAAAPNGALLVGAEDFRAELSRVTGARVNPAEVEALVKAQGQRSGKYRSVVDVSAFLEEVLGVPLGKLGRGELGRESPSLGKGVGGRRILSGLPDRSGLVAAVEKLTEGLRELDCAVVTEGSSICSDWVGDVDSRELAAVAARLCERGEVSKHFGPISGGEFRNMLSRFSLERDNGTVDYRRFVAKLAEVEPFREAKAEGAGAAGGMPKHRRNLGARDVEREVGRKLEQRLVARGTTPPGSLRLFAAGVKLAQERADAGKEAPSFAEFQATLAQNGIAVAPRVARMFYRDAVQPSAGSRGQLCLVVHGIAPSTWAPRRGKPLVSPASPAFNSRVRFFGDRGAALKVPVRHRTAQVY